MITIYSVLRLRCYGEVYCFCTDYKRQAFMYFYIACMFNVHEDSFIALFDGIVMLMNNQGLGKKPL